MARSECIRAEIERGFTHQTRRDETLSLRELAVLVLLDERLELVGREGVDPAGFGHDEEQDLRARQSRELVGLPKNLLSAGLTSKSYARRENAPFS